MDRSKVSAFRADQTLILLMELNEIKVLQKTLKQHGTEYTFAFLNGGKQSEQVIRGVLCGRSSVTVIDVPHRPQLCSPQSNCDSLISRVHVIRKPRMTSTMHCSMLPDQQQRISVALQ